MKGGEFFNFLDYIFIALMFISTSAGFARGFVKDFFGTCAWYGSGFIAVFIAPHLIPIISKHISNEILVRAAAVSISYIGVLIFLLLIINMLSQSIRKGMLSSVDRAAGVLFGLFKSAGFLICLHALMLIFEIPRDKYPPIKNSKLSTVFLNIAGLWMPKMVKLGLVDRVQKLSLSQKRIFMEEPLPIAKKEPPKKEKILKKVSPVAEIVKTIEEEKPIIAKKIDLLAKFEEIKNFVVNLIVKRETGYDMQQEAISQTMAPVEPPIREIQRPFDKPKYGAMSLMEARIKRRKQRKAAKLKKILQKHLDRRGL
ncbi:MAG: CvpA family protein [Holosporaceae bacterium]|jgi:membrane protein required for colicin V production|nr:CvpA family protein [Holosporaceae bacterium]